jgi:Domain of unknown function (DUF1707)
MVGPGDETGTGASGDSLLPATHAGRDQVIAALKTAFVQGRLSKDEFELRLGQALAIYAQLGALTADIPAAAPAVSPRPGPSREAANRKMIQQGTAAVASLTFVLAVGLVIPRNPVAGVLAGILLSCVMALFTAGFLTLLSWALERRSGGQGAAPAQGSPPGTGGEVTRNPGAADQQRSLPEIGEDPPHTVRVARRRARRLATTPA